MSNKRNRFQINIIGRERSGKTFYSQKFADKYIGKSGGVLAYNAGKPQDFPDSEFTLIEPLTFNEHIQYFYSGRVERQRFLNNPKIEYFWLNGKPVHFSLFNKIFHNQKVKMFSIPERKEENAFFKTLFLYCSNMLLILDDCFSIFRYGLNAGHIQLFSRKNHTGRENILKSFRGQGMDIILIWHNPDHVTSDLWDFSTHNILFSFPNIPDLGKVNNDALGEQVRFAKVKLDAMPKYYAIQLGMNGETPVLIKPQE